MISGSLVNEGATAEPPDGACQAFLLLDEAGRLVSAGHGMARWLPPRLLRPGTNIARLAVAAANILAHAASRLLTLHNQTAEFDLPNGTTLRLCATDTGAGTLVLCSDITAVRRQATCLYDHHLALNNLSLGVCLYAPDATVRMANARYSEVLGVAPGLARPGATMRDLLSASVAAGHHGDSTLEMVDGVCQRLIAGRIRQRLVITLASGRLVGFDHIPLPDGGWLATFEDITERKRLEEHAVFLARHDSLTKLPNRAVLQERLQQAVAETGRGARFALLCLNLDHFKVINDTLGHAIGDQLLCAVADRISACVRETDLVCRLGGDEFAIIQTRLGRAEHSAEQAHRLVNAFAAPFELDGQTIQVGVSIGITVAPEDGTQPETLLRQADTAMERAKDDGRGIYRLFEREMDARVQARRTLELDLRRALAANAFDLHFQPLVDITAGRVTGFEALLRWPHPDGHMVSPADFIPLAEDIGLIVPLGKWVLRAACQAAAAWPPGLRVAVNVSPVQFKAGLVPAAVAEALQASGLPARRLELEITESVLLSNNTATLDVLRGLRAQGVRISMDDFGTGFSSLSYLRSFPFDKIKIDQSFIRDLAESADSAAIVDAIIGLGRSLGMRVTAEGVETAAQLAHLRAAGCDEVQGYYFSKPRPGAEVPAIIEKIESATV